MRLDSDGNFVWEENFVMMCSVASNKVHSVAGQFNNNQIIASWEDSRNGGSDIYAQNITFEGLLGVINDGYVEGNVVLNGGSGIVTDVDIEAGGMIVNPEINGDYSIILTPGTYDVTASLDGYEQVTIDDVEVTSGNSTTGIDFSLEPIVSSENIVITNAVLGHNYPNPFNPVTNISYSIIETGYVTLEVYNLKGQLVKTLINEIKETGEHITSWDGNDNSNKPVSSGVYLYKMKSTNYSFTRKMILMK
jgi:hypothetical protein